MFKKLVMSSSDPKKLALTAKGILTSLVPIIMLLLGLTEDQVITAIDQVEVIIIAVFSIISAIQIIGGLYRKAVLGRWTAYRG